jgi:hypothetical protein
LVWDLNPEGVGVQPMIANVTMSFKFIGASTLMGPLNKLQNALSFNYFANTQVYDPRADYIAKDGNKKDAKGNEIPNYVLMNGLSGTAINEIVITPEIIADNTPEIDQEKAAEQVAVAEAVEIAPSATTATTATTIDDTAVMGCFGYEGAYKIDQSDPTDFSVDIVMSWNAKKDVKDPELNASHNAFVYVKNGSKEQVVLGHIRISPNSPGNLIFKHYDDKNGSKTGGGSDQIISFAGQQNKTLIKFEVNFNIDDATKGKFILDAWNATGGNGSPSMIKIEWQDANGSGMNAGFSHLYALKFPNET